MKSDARKTARTVWNAARCNLASLLCTAALLLGAPAQVAGKSVAPAAEPAKAASMATPATLVQMADGRLLAPDIARIVNRGELVVAMLGTDSPPFFYTRNGEVVGMEVDLARAIAKELKVTVRFDRSPKTFNEVVAVVARQGADLGISKLSRTLSRAQVISFSEPYLRLNHALLLNRLKLAAFARDQPLPAVIRGFTGSIGVIAKSSFADYAAHNFPKAEIREFASWADVLQALQQGQIIAAYRDEFEIKRFLRSDSAAALTLRTITFKDLEDTLGIAVGIQDPTLLSFVNQFLAQSTEKFSIDKVLNAASP